MELINANKFYKKGNQKIQILKNASIKFELGKIYMIIGESGAGKTTLINILGLLDKLDGGQLIIDGNEVTNYKDSQLSILRLEKIGLIFQDYYLNPRLTAYENVYIATLINNKIKNIDRDEIIHKSFKYFEIEDRMKHYPSELSGGEQQRVCIARSLINNPDYVLADEPTGSLDPKNASNVMNILKKLSKEGKCIILVTHDYTNVQYADYIYSLKDGVLNKENKNDFSKKYIEKKHN